MSKARKDPELHYYKRILTLSQHQYLYALKESTKAIDESTARHYFAKGFSEACLNMFKEAIEDLDIAIKLEEGFTDAYFIKGKCAYLGGDTNTAFMCYQQLIIMNKNDPFMLEICSWLAELSKMRSKLLEMGMKSGKLGFLITNKQRYGVWRI